MSRRRKHRNSGLPKLPSATALDRMRKAIDLDLDGEHDLASSGLEHLSITPAPAAHHTPAHLPTASPTPKPLTPLHAAPKSPPRPEPQPWTIPNETEQTSTSLPQTAHPDLADLAEFEHQLDHPSVPETLAIRRLKTITRLMAIAEERLFSDEHPFDPDDDKRYRILCREWMRLNSFLQRRVDARARLAARFDSQRFRDNLFPNRPQHSQKNDVMTTSHPIPQSDGGPRQAETLSTTPADVPANNHAQHPKNNDLMTTPSQDPHAADQPPPPENHPLPSPDSSFATLTPRAHRVASPVATL